MAVLPREKTVVASLVLSDTAFGIVLAVLLALCTNLATGVAEWNGWLAAADVGLLLAAISCGYGFYRKKVAEWETLKQIDDRAKVGKTMTDAEERDWYDTRLKRALPAMAFAGLVVLMATGGAVWSLVKGREEQQGQEDLRRSRLETRLQTAIDEAKGELGKLQTLMEIQSGQLEQVSDDVRIIYMLRQPPLPGGDSDREGSDLQRGGTPTCK